MKQINRLKSLPQRRGSARVYKMADIADGESQIYLLSKPAVDRLGIERHPYSESYLDQFPFVCVYDYSSQTTGPICIKITLVDSN